MLNARILVIVVAITLSAGCSTAKKAMEVGANYVPVYPYANLTCNQLVNEAENLRRVIPALEAIVDAHRSQQTAVEAVTWLLFWPAAFFFDGGEQQSNDLAQARGQLQAVQQALLNKQC